MVIFQSAIPMIGIGALQGQPNEADMVNTDKEKTLFKPRDKVWRDIAEECAMEGIGINLVLTPSRYIDIGSIGKISSVWEGKATGVLNRFSRYCGVCDRW